MTDIVDKKRFIDDEAAVKLAQKAVREAAAKSNKTKKK